MISMIVCFAIFLGTTYSSIKMTSYYLYISVFYGIISQLLWAISAKKIDDKNFLYFYGNLWDALLVITGGLLPLAFGVQMKSFGYLGLLLIGTGLFILKKAL